MAYIGNTPAESFASFEKQVFTIVNSQTAYTLNHAVTNENDIRLVINSVVQEPGSGKAYTASGTTLTLSAALTNGTDTMYCVFLGRALQTVNPPNASVGTAQLGSSLDFSSKTITLASNMKNTPSFQAGLSSNQSIPNTTTTVVINDTEIYDTDSAYNTSTGIFTVPSGKAGKYYFYSLVRRNNFEPAARFTLGIKKNGTEFTASDMSIKGNYAGGFIGSQTNCSAGDEIKPVVYHDDGAAANIFGTAAGSFTYFGGYRIIGV